MASPRYEGYSYGEASFPAVPTPPSLPSMRPPRAELPAEPTRASALSMSATSGQRSILSTRRERWGQYGFRPNIIFHLTDDWGWPQWPVPGAAPSAIYPTIKRDFIDNGIELKRMYSSSICGPSRRSLLSGRHFAKVGRHNNDCPALPLDMDTLFDSLKKSGYKTALFGKYHIVGRSAIRTHTPSAHPTPAHTICANRVDVQGFYQEEALPGRRGVDEGLQFYRGSIVHNRMCSGHGSACRTFHYQEQNAGRRSLTTRSNASRRSLAAYAELDIYDVQQTVAGVDYNAGLQFLRDNQAEPSAIGGTGVFADQLYKERAVTLIEGHDFDAKPLFVYLSWAGPHLPHQTYDLKKSGATVDDARCAQLKAERPQSVEASECTGDYFYRQCAWISTGQVHQECLQNANDCQISECIAADPARADAERGNHRTYEAQTHEMDIWIGEVHDAVRSRGVWNSTLSIWQSDNGGNNQWMMNMPLRGGKFTLWEGGIRVRAAVGGGVIPVHLRGRATDAVFHSIDWLPTLSFAAGSGGAARAAAAGPPD
eukprot:788127-Prymnesium_polylepis.1